MNEVLEYLDNQNDLPMGRNELCVRYRNLFGALLTEMILFPVPHRHFTFGIPKMLRPYFRFDRTRMLQENSKAELFSFKTLHLWEKRNSPQAIEAVAKKFLDFG